MVQQYIFKLLAPCSLQDFSPCIHLTQADYSSFTKVCARFSLIVLNPMIVGYNVLYYHSYVTNICSMMSESVNVDRAGRGTV